MQLYVPLYTFTHPLAMPINTVTQTSDQVTGVGTLFQTGTPPLEDGDYIVVLDLETGEERGRVHSGAAQSSGMFFCPGWDRDVYYATLFGQIARIYVG